MRVAVCTVAYREEDFIERCVEQFRGKVAEHLVLLSDVPWHGEREPFDRTKELAEALGASVVVGSWTSEAEQRNLGQHLLAEYDWILIVDADEYYTTPDIDYLLDFLSAAPLPAYVCGRLVTYWKSPEWRIDPIESGLTVAVRPSVRFTDKRCVDAPWEPLPNAVTMHHYSYVRSDEQMLRKLATFEHASEIVPGWYENVWLNWDPGMENLHPVHPSCWKKAVPCR